MTSIILSKRVGFVLRISTGECTHSPRNQKPVPSTDSLKPFFGMQSRRMEQVAGNVLAHQLVVRHVSVERADHVVAILVRVLCIVVELMATRFGIPDQIEPMSAPSLAEVRRLQQLIHKTFDGSGKLIMDQLLHLTGCRGQADQVKAKSPRKRAAVNFTSWMQASRFKSRKNEKVQLTLRPRVIGHRGQWRAAYRLPDPVL